MTPDDGAQVIADMAVLGGRHDGTGCAWSGAPADHPGISVVVGCCPECGGVMRVGMTGHGDYQGSDPAGVADALTAMADMIREQMTAQTRRN